MDLQLYYQKIRDMEAKIAGQFPIVVSLETADGGKAGTKTEVPRRIAARLAVEGLARLATPEETKEFQALQEEAKRAADQMAAATRVQLSVLSTADLNRLKGAARSSKE
jgi:hypothetical protein